MRGNITRRGKSSWRIKFDADRDSKSGQRLTKFVTVRGTRKDAERELTRLLTAVDGGTLVDPSKVTVAEYLDSWLLSAATDISPRHWSATSSFPISRSSRTSARCSCRSCVRRTFKTGTACC